MSSVDGSEDSGGPVGEGEYVVESGDCISSIAFQHGFFWKTIWDWPENAELKQVRKDPNALLAGDCVTIPEKRPKEDDAATEKLHKYKLKGVPARLRLKFLDDDKPRAGVKYIVWIDGKAHEGKLDKAGMLDLPIPPDAQKAIIRLADDEKNQMEVNLGSVDPITEVSGVQGRLNNLGYDTGPVNNRFGPQTADALRRFQQQEGLQVTGKIDQATRDHLQKVHDK